MASHFEEYLIERFAAEFSDLEKHPGVIIQMTAIEAWSLLSSIQLACRHPQFIGPTREMAEAIAIKIQGKITQTPALAIVAQKGWEGKS